MWLSFCKGGAPLASLTERRTGYGRIDMRERFNFAAPLEHKEQLRTLPGLRYCGVTKVTAPVVSVGTSATKIGASPVPGSTVTSSVPLITGLVPMAVISTSYPFGIASASVNVTVSCALVVVLAVTEVTVSAVAVPPGDV